MKSSYSAEYIWKIKHFSTCNPGIGVRIDSEFFNCPEKENVKFRLGFCPNNTTFKNKDFTSIFLWIGCENSINANISYDLISKADTVVFNSELQDVYVPANETRGWGFESFVLRNFIMDPLNNVLDDDTLTIRCRIDFSFGDVMVVFNPKNSSQNDDLQKVFNTEYLWKIENFEKLSAISGSGLDSDFFICEDKSEIGFRMGLCPNGDCPENEGYVSLNLWIGSDKNLDTVIIFDIVTEDVTCLSKECHQIVLSHETRGWGFPQFIERNILLNPKNNLLKNGCLTIHCKVAFKYCGNTDSNDITPTLATPALASLKFNDTIEEIEAQMDIDKLFDFKDSTYFTEKFWEIQNFSKINYDIRNRVESDIFCCVDKPDIKFRLGLFPNGNADRNKGFLSIHLWIRTPLDLRTTISIEILSNDNESKYKKERQDVVHNNSDQGWGFDQFIERSKVLDEKNGYANNDTLKIKCHISVTFCEIENELNSSIAIADTLNS